MIVWPEWPGLTEPLWTDPYVKSGISFHNLMSIKKKLKKERKKESRWGMHPPNFASQILAQGKRHHILNGGLCVGLSCVLKNDSSCSHSQTK